MTPPSTVTFIGALVVFAGTAIILASFLAGSEKRDRESKMNAVGTCIIGVGTAMAFYGLSEDLTGGERSSLPLAFGGVLVVFVVAAFAAVRKDRKDK